MLEGLSWIQTRCVWGYCVTFARGLEEPEMLGRFVGDPARAWLVPELVEDEDLREELEAEEEEAERDGRLVHVGSCDGWAFALEDGGTSFEGLRPEVLRRVSAGTVALSLSLLGSKGTRTCCYAEDGVVIARWSDVLPVENGEDPARIHSLLQKVRNDYHPQSVWEEMAAFAEVIGVRLDRESVAEKPLFQTWVNR